MKQSENQMGTKAIFPLLMGMSVPPMISMLIQSLYNIVDSIFVAKLGEEALTAVSLAYPLQNLVLAVAVGLGVATNAAIARNLGAKKSEEANDAAAPWACADRYSFDIFYFAWNLFCKTIFADVHR